MSGNIQTHNIHTTIATWVMPILRALEPYCESSELLARSGIDADCIVDANQRIPIEKMTRLWELAEEVSGDDCIGLEVIKHVTPTSFHALSYAHHASSSLRESLQLMEKFSEVVTTAIRVETKETPTEVIVHWHLVDGSIKPSPHAEDAFIGLIVNAGTQLFSTNNPTPIISLKLARDKPQNTTKHDELFKCPITYGAEHCELHMARQIVDTHLPTGNAELVRINEQVLTEYLVRFKKNDIAAAVYKTLLEIMPDGEPTQEKVAAALGTSSRSLHRKLKELNTSYKTIVDETRQHLARQYLKQSDQSITSITYQLGFKDVSSFSRSFKRWTGLSPSEFRSTSRNI